MIGPMPDPVDAASTPGPNSLSLRTRGLEPALLLVGAGAELEEPLAAALGRHGLFVEIATPAGLLGATITAAPDLILLAGESARDGGGALLRELSASPLTSVVPVALLQEEPSVDARLKAFRHGAVAVVARSPSIDAMALEIAHLAREIPERTGASLGQLGESTLRGFVDALARELRQGVLSVKTGESEPELRLVLGEGRPLVELVDDFVQRVRRHVIHAEPLRYEFDERATGTVAWLGKAAAGSGGVLGNLAGVPLALADPDAARADVLAQSLREQGATVMITDLEPPPARYSRLRQLDPLVLLIGASDVEGRGYELLRQMKYDPRLRWTSLLVVDWADVIPEVGLPSVEHLVSRIIDLTSPLRTLRTRILAASGSIGARLESVGPAHLLRMLTEIPEGTRIEVHHRRLKAAVDIAEHLVAGVTATRPEAPGAVLQGPVALAALLQLGSGRVRIDRVAQPASTNLMATLASALDLADREVAPILPFLPSPGWSQPPDAGQVAVSVPRSSRLPVLGEVPGTAHTPADDPAHTELDVRVPLSNAATALALGEPSQGHPRETGGMRPASFEPMMGGATGPYRAPAKTAVGLGGGLEALGQPNGSDKSAEPVLLGMPSPNRDYETLIEGLADSPQASRGESRGAEASEVAPVASENPLAAVDSGLASEAAATAFAVPPTPGLAASAPTARESIEDSSLTIRLSRVLLQLRPGLGMEEARNLVILALVAAASLLVAFVIAFAIGTLLSDDAGPDAARSSAGSGLAGVPSGTGVGALAGAASGGRGGPAARRAVALPSGVATDNPAPSCEALLKEAKSPSQRYPGAALDQVAIGRKALVRGSIETAHVAYCRALQLDPEIKRGRNELARLLILRRDGKGAEKQARSAMELEPKSRVVRGILGDALARLGRYDEAREAFIYEAQADPSNNHSMQSLYDTTLKYALREKQKGSRVEAERLFRRAVALDPADPRGAAGLAGMLLQLGDKGEAVQWAKYAAALGGLGAREQDDVTRVLGAGQVE